LEIPETSVLLRGERNAVGLTAVFSVRAFSGARETWRKNNFLLAPQISHARKLDQIPEEKLARLYIPVLP
jgi:hypothetical protein